MKKIIFTFLSTIFFAGAVKAQQWDWAYEGNGVTNPKMVMLNNYIYLTGTYTTNCKVRNQTLNSSAGGSGFLMKLDGNANTIWTKTFDAAALRISGVKTWNNVIYIAGSFQGNLTGSSVNLSSAGDYDSFFAGFSENGALQLSKRDGDARYQDIVDFDADSTLIVTGQFARGSVISGQNLNSSCLNNSNVYFAKYNLSGQNLWVKEIAGDSTQGGNAVSIRFDRNRKIIFQGQIGGRQNYAGIDTGFCDYCQPLLRFDPSGNFVEDIMETQDGCSCGGHFSWDVAFDAADNIYNLGSQTCGSCGGQDIRLQKTRDKGQMVWDKRLTSNTYASQTATGVAFPYRFSENGNNLYIAGRLGATVHFTGGDTTVGNYLFIANFDTLGNFKSLRTAAGSTSNYAQTEANSMINDGSGNVYITGLLDHQTTFGTAVLNGTNSTGKFYIARLGVQALAVQMAEKDHSFSVSPNPSQGKIFVNAKGSDKAVNICVYNVLGHCILSQPAQSVSVLDLSDQPKGVYFVSLESKSGRDIKRVVVE